MALIDKAVNIAVQKVNGRSDSFSNLVASMVLDKFAKLPKTINGFLETGRVDNKMQAIAMAESLVGVHPRLLETAINLSQKENETADEANLRVRSEVSKLFGALDLARRSAGLAFGSKEDLRFKEVSEKPQVVFNMLRERAFMLEDGNRIEEKLRLTKALVDSGVVEGCDLKVVSELPDGYEDHALFFKSAARENIRRKFTGLVSKRIQEVAGSSVEGNRSTQTEEGLETYKKLECSLKVVYGKMGKMPVDARNVIRKSIPVSILADMAHPGFQNEEEVISIGVNRYLLIRKKMRLIFGKMEKMPKNAIAVIEKKIEPTLNIVYERMSKSDVPSRVAGAREYRDKLRVKFGREMLKIGEVK